MRKVYVIMLIDTLEEFFKIKLFYRTVKISSKHFIKIACI